MPSRWCVRHIQPLCPVCSFDTLYCVLCSLSCPWAVVHYSLLGTLYPLFWCTLRWCPVCCVRHIVPPVFWCVRHIVPLPDWKRAERETGKNIPGIRSTADCTTKYRLICGDINQPESINWLNGEFMWVVLCPLHVRVTSRGLGNITWVIEGGGQPFLYQHNQTLHLRRFSAILSSLQGGYLQVSIINQ